jgi:excisionase family DNA binding protein
VSGRLLTANQVAERLAVTERYVWRLAREGRLASYRVGKYLRFAEADLEIYVDGCRTTPPRAILAPRTGVERRSKARRRFGAA